MIFEKKAVRQPIQKDAGELLMLLYEQYLQGKEIDGERLRLITEWSEGRIDRAISYLEDINAIKVLRGYFPLLSTQSFTIRGLTHHGVGLIEQRPEFKRTFGFEIGIPGIKFNWQSTEK